MAAKNKKAIQRLMFDQEELRKAPVANVSAAPLDENMFEWHCNIRQDDIIFHLILFFPQNYPYSSPSAEFVPVGFNYSSGATKPGKKGTKICLNIFSDFADIHTEWKGQKGLGWSPGYTVQMVLMNVVAFLAETQDNGSSSHSFKQNLKLSKEFKCEDCGHTYRTPQPSLDDETDSGESKKGKGKGAKGKKEGAATAKAQLAGKAQVAEKAFDAGPEIIDYISKEKFKIKKPSGVDDLFGYGLAVSGTNWRPVLTSPCEFITGSSFFGMKKAVKVVHSVMKEELKLFLPLYIHPIHGAEIKDEFEKTLKEVAVIMPKHDPNTTPITDLVLKTIPNLMSATVVEFSKGTQHTSDNSLNGYFALHRLLLWAADTYPELQDAIETKVQEYVEDERNRTKSKVPYIAEWLMLVAASKKYRWQDVADAYLSESWRRNVIWYVKADAKLGFLDTPQDYRIRRTLEETDIARKHLAFQVRFLDIAMPAKMSRDEVIKRYDNNFGFPTKEMVDELKDAFVKINNEMKTYQDWFKILKLPVLTDKQVFDVLVEAVKFSIVRPGYFWSSAKTGGGWAQVFEKYADMRRESFEKYKKEKEEREKAAKKEDGGAEGDKEEESSEGKGASGKGRRGGGRGAARGGRGTARGGRGASARGGKGAGRGRKRKSSSSDDEDWGGSKKRR
ncbi:uncharacterized protein LOC101857027 [Aplysia californica]|uniref:Uncharacterized protein LOC101857027 n=1 Tax=Aplysia californica TaxID=6500 RepID=A0ABM0JRH4_APLCA|nr:uncharacterized protein LOC101857027 [Aplysia californica]XP_005099841.1 uncharacterized protein LOC101857027 [Aplysia californica]XP_012938792.1 uncharacterized protein LOC101857027 [Aplysia californica]